MEIKDSLKTASLKVLSDLKKQSVKITKKDIRRVAEISAENTELATLVSDIINKIGEEAVITVEDSRTFETTVEIVDGYQPNVGFMSPHFINEPKRARCVMNDVAVFVSEKKISSIQDIAPLFEMLKKEGISQSVIVCEDIENSILGILVANKMTGNFNSLVIRATGAILMDIEAVVGATRVSETTGVSFQNITPDKIGHAKKVVADANKSLFIPSKVDSALEYANHLQKMVNEEDNIYIKERLIKRVAQLKGGIGIIKVGANSDFEREYLKLKAEDAIKASKAALEEGIVPGGGITLWRLANAMKPKTVGEEILKKALTAPLRKILENAGKDYADIIKDMPADKGYDAKNKCYVDMVKSGIIDPSKVERCAIENSVKKLSDMLFKVNFMQT